MRTPNKKHWTVLPSARWKQCGPVYRCRACALVYCGHMCATHRNSCAGAPMGPDADYQALQSAAMKEWWAKHKAKR